MAQLALFNLCQDNGSLLHQLDPRTKLIGLIFVLIEALVAARVWQLAILLSLVLIIFPIGGLAWRKLKLSFLALLIMAVQILAFQLLFRHSVEYLHPAPWLSLDREGLMNGIMSVLRLACLVLAAMAFLQFTHPTDLTLLMMKGGLGYRYAMLLGLAIRFLPLMEGELRAIYESQRSRGLSLNGPWQQLKGLIPVALPFLFRAFQRSQSVALAMELQGFGLYRERTFLRSLRLQPLDYGLSAVFGLAMIGTFFIR